MKHLSPYPDFALSNTWHEYINAYYLVSPRIVVRDQTMDPSTAILEIANLLAVVDNLYRGVKFVRRAVQDPKEDAFYVRLITEKARFAEWKRRIGIESTDDVEALLSKLPVNAQNSLSWILISMYKYVRESKQLF